MEAPPAQYVRTKDGYDIAYCDVGTGRPVVLLPGRLNSMAYTWYRWSRTETAATSRCDTPRSIQSKPRRWFSFRSR